MARPPIELWVLEREEDAKKIDQPALVRPEDIKTGKEKLEDIARLMNDLAADLDYVTFFPDERATAFELLKIYSRDPQDADPLFTTKGMDTLLRHAYESPSSRTAFAAMRVVANAMRLKPQTRQIFVDSGLAPKACRYMKIENWNDEFLGARILFLATYDTNIDLTKLIDEHQLATRILDRLHVHAKRLKKTKSKPEEMEEEALAETLKLMFNVTYHCPNRVASFSPSAADLVALLFKMDFFLPDPLDPFFKAICNALLNVDMSAGKLKSSLFPKSEVGKVPNRIIHLLGACTEMYDDAGLESLVAPVVSLVKKMHEYAPEKDGEVFRERLLPTVEGRRNVQV